MTIDEKLDLLIRAVDAYKRILPVLVVLAVLSACATLTPSSDPVVVRTQDVLSNSLAVYDSAMRPHYLSSGRGASRPMSLFPRSDLLRALSTDSQARLTTDPNRPVRIGTGDGVTDTWDAPFLEASTLKGYVDGTVVAGTTLLRATGTDGADQIRFTTAPGAGKLVAVSADALAVNKAAAGDGLAYGSDDPVVCEGGVL